MGRCLCTPDAILQPLEFLKLYLGNALITIIIYPRMFAMGNTGRTEQLCRLFTTLIKEITSRRKRIKNKQETSGTLQVRGGRRKISNASCNQ